MKDRCLFFFEILITGSSFEDRGGGLTASLKAVSPRWSELKLQMKEQC